MYSPRVINFFTIAFVSAIVFGLIGIIVLDSILGPEEPLCYVIVITGLAFASVVFALRPVSTKDDAIAYYLLIH